MDRFAQLMGFIMIALTLYVAFKTEPPVVEAAYRTFIPEQVDPIAIAFSWRNRRGYITLLALTAY